MDEEKVAADGNQTKRVQDLAETGNGSPPLRYIQLESNRPSLDPPPCTIPVVDLSRLLQPEEGAKLRSALHSWDLFQVVGHGIPSSTRSETSPSCSSSNPCNTSRCITAQDLRGTATTRSHPVTRFSIGPTGCTSKCSLSRRGR